MYSFQLPLFKMLVVFVFEKELFVYQRACKQVHDLKLWSRWQSETAIALCKVNLMLNEFIDLSRCWLGVVSHSFPSFCDIRLLQNWFS